MEWPDTAGFYTAFFTERQFFCYGITMTEVMESRKEDMHMTEPVLLLGLSKAGKTSAGRILAQLLSCPFYDTDAVIQSHTGAPPRLIYRETGLATLHTAEAAALKECLSAAARHSAVIAAGGGICDNPAAAALIPVIPERIFLYAEKILLFRRLTQEAEQTGTYPAFLQSLPAVKKTEAERLFSGLYARRTAAYRRIATRIFNTGSLGAAAIGEQIAELLHRCG